MIPLKSTQHSLENALSSEAGSTLEYHRPAARACGRLRTSHGCDQVRFVTYSSCLPTSCFSCEATGSKDVEKTHHQALRIRSLNMENCSRIPENLHTNAFSVFSHTEIISPSNETRCRWCVSEIKMLLHRDRKTMQWSYWNSMFFHVSVK
jgi:hypothetical protein